MVKKCIIALTAITLMYSPGSAKKLAGVEMPESFKAGKNQLVLNGIGLREKYALGVDVYVAGLYLKSKCGDGIKISNADEPMAMRLQIVTGLVTPKKFINHTLDGFDESCENLKIDKKSIAKEIDEFVSVFKDKISKNDTFDIIYTSENGVQVFKNGSKTSPVSIKGLSIKRALFGIWLTERSEKYLNALKDGMLGK